MKPLHSIWLIPLLFCMISCSPNSENKETEKEVVIEEAEETSLENFIGDYVTSGYFQREDGYDWTVVRILPGDQNKLIGEVSSRSDLKRPSCSAAFELQLNDSSNLEAMLMNQKVFFLIIGDSLEIQVETEEGENALHFFCNGGASLAGTYTKLEEDLDSSQYMNYTFEEELSLQKIKFDIKATEQNPYTTLLVQPEGLEISNEAVVQKVDGCYLKSEIEDLYSDGWPEILIFFNSYGMEMKGMVVGFSVNNGKSMSQISMPELSEEASQGFRGQDQFEIVENSLVQRFPIYEQKGDDWVQTGKTRQVQYKLRDGEASRQFFETNISEY